MTDFLTNFLGKPASTILTSAPFKLWKFERSVEEDLPEHFVDYVCEQHGLSLTCDSDETINSIFLEADTFDQSLVDIPFSSSRYDVLKLLGTPSKSGEASTHPILGEHSAWDRFDGQLYSIHIEFQPQADRIKMVTLMRADVVP